MKDLSLRPQCKKQMLSHLPWDEVGAKYASGWGFKRLADHFAVSRGAMRHALKNRGLRRPYAERTITARAVRHADQKAATQSWRAAELDHENVVWMRHERCWNKWPTKRPRSAISRAKETSTAKDDFMRNLRRRMRKVLKRSGAVAHAKHSVLLGCTTHQMLQYIESRFSAGQGWHNHGQWHGDHIRPCASFDLTDKAHQLACFHYTNLQPMWASENMAKRDKWQAA